MNGKCTKESLNKTASIMKANETDEVKQEKSDQNEGAVTAEQEHAPSISLPSVSDLEQSTDSGQTKQGKDVQEVTSDTKDSTAVRLYTGPYGRIDSPFKKTSSFSSPSRGIKRSPRKLPVPRAKKKKLLSEFDQVGNESSGDSDLDTGPAVPPVVNSVQQQQQQQQQPAPSTSQQHTQPDESCDETDSDEDQWQIVEDSDSEIDKKLDKQSERFSLSAINVKSIIHQIVTNEHVVEMVRKAVLEQVEEKRLEYEPKMTRSKVKEVIETHGDVPLHLSPIKKTSFDESKFVELDFPEDEDDDKDFDPDELSDEESESFLSSGFSDCDTNSLPPTPTTPKLQPSPASVSQTPTNVDTDNSNSILSPMGPPLQIFVPKSQHKHTSLGQKYREAIEEEQEKTRKEKELIATRTRSKCPLNEVSIVDIESNFVAPDITADMYDTTCDDKEWKEFLKTLVVFDTATTNEDTNEAGCEEEDPEFDFLAETNDHDYDHEDFRNDRAVKVSKKELSSLMDELYELYEEDDPIDINSKNIIKARTENVIEEAEIQSDHSDHSDESDCEIPDNLIHETGEKERRQITDQLRKHVQLLTQSYVLAMDEREENKNVMDAVNMFLTELKSFSDRSAVIYKDTLFRDVCNLPQALSVIKDHSWNTPVTLTEQETSKIDNLVFKYESLTLPRLSYNQMKLFWTSPVFIYPELLPQGGFYRISDYRRDRSNIKFLEAEDNLLAIGIDQFRQLKDSKKYINDFMLPCKTMKQIKTRIKNLSAKTAKNNAVKYLKENGRLPVFKECVPLCDASQLVACCDKVVNPDLCPHWTSFFRPGSASVDDSRSPNKEKCSQLTYMSDAAQMEVSEGETSPVTPVPSTDSSVSSCSSGKSKPTSQVNNKRCNTSRKKLDLDKAVRPSVPAFVPLTFSGSTRTSPSSLSNMSSCTSSSNSSVVSVCTSTVSSLVSVCTSTVSSLVSVCTSTVSSVRSPVVKNNPASQTTQAASSTTTNTVDSSSLGKTTNTAGFITKDGKLFIIAPQNVNTNKTSVVLVKSSGNSDLTTSNNNNNALVSVSVCSTSLSTVVTSSICETSSPVAVSGAGSTSIIYTPTSGRSPRLVQVVSGHTDTQTVMSCSHRPAVQAHTGDRGSNMSTPPPYSSSILSSPSAAADTHKSALEIMAAYAPCFLTPSSKIQQQKLETTPVKRSEFIRLAPKPTPPGALTSPVDVRVPKIRSSPRRHTLNHKAKAILPKGFIIRTFDISPTKKAATSLVEKAKHPGRGKKNKSYYFTSSSGYCKILPQPKDSNNSGDTGRRTSIKSPTASKPHSDNTPTGDDDKENVEHQYRNKSRHQARPDSGERQSEGMSTDRQNTGTSEDRQTDVCKDGESVDEDEEYKGDTESDYTQSEDGNETQEELDSQEEIDSQDDDNHIADLMYASTTTRYEPGREERSHLGKKDRDRDIHLAMLAPDVIAADPQRDMRDTAYAQAYLHKVKKVLREDMETLEKFLQLMYNFSKVKESPIKLYEDLQDLLREYPGLVQDFAGFLLPEQAVECGCYDVYREFSSARKFLRKLEIYFSKTPHHFQRIIKTFSRWYRKPGKKTADLKMDIEPMLKGHKHLLEEFSRFFPEEQPPDSCLDEFEEIHVDGSEDELEYDSFEEIEMLDNEEILGTNFCTCSCHSWKDETYRKKKKHCYRCCLTVIDGELVYRVNKSIIKKVDITFGPRVAVNGLLSADGEDMYNIEELNDPTTAEEIPVDDMNDVTESTSADEIKEMSDTDGLIKTIEPTESTAIDKTTECNELSGHETITESEISEPSSIDRTIEISESSITTKVSDTYSKSKTIEISEPITKSKMTEIIDPSAKNKTTDIGEPLTTNKTEVNEPTKITKTKEICESTIIDKVSKDINSTRHHTGTDSDILNCSQETSLTVASGPVSVNTDHIETDMEVDPEPHTDRQTVATDSGSIVDGKEKVTMSTSLKRVEIADDKVTTECDSVHISTTADSMSDTPTPAQHTQNSTPAVHEPNIDTVESDSKSVPVITVTSDVPACQTVSVDEGCSSSHTDGPDVNNTATNSSTDKSIAYDILAAAFNTVMSEASVHNVFPFPLASQVNKNMPTKTVNSDAQKKKPDKSEENKDSVSVKSDQDHVDVSCSSGVTTVDKPISTVGPSGPRPQSDSDSSQQPFSPFSPFGLEVQSITGARSPVPHKPVLVPRVRRITPIPVTAGTGGDDQSFQSVVQNSPVISDTIHSPLGQVVIDKPTDTSTQGSKPGGQDTQGSNSGSQGSAGTVTGSQKSDTSTKSSEPSSFSALKISKPALFSEDANVGFTRTSDLGNITSHISDESLLQCLARPTNFNDTIASVSNLTNILHALDEKTTHQSSELHGENTTDKLTHKTCASDGQNTVGEEIKMDVGQKTKHSVLHVDRECMSSSTSSDGSDNKCRSAGQYFPHSVDSIENLERLKSGLFTVTSLSDSESCTNLTTGNTAGTCSQPADKDSLNIQTEHVDNSSKGSSNNKSRCNVQLVSRTDVSSAGHQTDSVENVAGQPVGVSADNVDKSENRHIDTEAHPHSSDKIQPEQTHAGGNVNTPSATTYSHQTDTVCNIDKHRKKKKRKLEDGSPPDHKKKKKRRNKKEEEYKGVDSPSGSSQDSQADLDPPTSVVQDNQQLDTEQGSLNTQTVQSSTQQTHLSLQTSATLEPLSSNRQDDNRSTAGEAASVVVSTDPRPSIQITASQHSPHTQQPSQHSSSQSSSSDQPQLPVWTKETDRIILEKCKTGGEKEKTFIKIAKRLGNVTPKQVRSRFSQLCQLIFKTDVG